MLNNFEHSAADDFSESSKDFSHLSKLAVIVALQKEAQPILQAFCGDYKTWDSYGVTFIQGKIASNSKGENPTLTICFAGMGKCAAAAAAQALIIESNPQVLIFSGIAGALNPRLSVGDIVIGKKLHYLETNTQIIAECAPYKSVFESDPKLCDLAAKEAQLLGFRLEKSLEESSSVAGDLFSDFKQNESNVNSVAYVCGNIATSDQFNTNPNILDVVRATVFGDCEEMEGAAAAHIAAKNGVPFLAIRSMSNRCGESYESVDSHKDDLVLAANQAGSLTLRVLKALVK
ncbi:5'-methylthioadenosine/S-adenosylhomocysteine nucleosidase [Gardnerella vaginalis]|uniref:5'-methylthioadenosine/S-adenosylhomocysteine nucleosidase family protein n=1 Tax=Gardnerella vaginalis TaxID=2702 RepID=UPI0015741E14|nr:5'-methylthioadenosine/S-adenosylhomocysteine nucleosidase [Gardnerella vaginalis]NSX28167.1 5'-methylthioadenosine/S-adenosylhomocysteine nucleosidase [Gardnerella vaginalis]